MLCDRKIVQECVTIWFGSQKDFEHCARTEVLEVLTRGLEEQLLTRGGQFDLGPTPVSQFSRPNSTVTVNLFVGLPKISIR